MSTYLARAIVLLVTFTLGVGAAGAVRYLRGGEAVSISRQDRKPFVFVVRKRTKRQ